MLASQQTAREACTRRKRCKAGGIPGNEARGLRVHTQGTTAVGKVKVEQARLFWRQVGLLLELPCEAARAAPPAQHRHSTRAVRVSASTSAPLHVPRY